MRRLHLRWLPAVLVVALVTGGDAAVRGGPLERARRFLAERAERRRERATTRQGERGERGRALGLEALFHSGEFQGDGKPRSSAFVQFIRFERGPRAVLKEDKGGHFNPEIEKGGWVRRERAVFVTDRHLGLGLVPHTELREIDGREHAVQLRLAGHVAQRGDPLRGIRVDRIDWDAVHGLAILDYVTNQRDRHGDNLRVIERDGRVGFRPIDNEWSFVTGAASRLEKAASASYLLAIAGAERGHRRLSAELAGKLRQVDDDALRQDLAAAGVEGREIDAAIGRLHRVQRHGLAALFRFPVTGMSHEVLADGRAAFGLR